VLGLPQDLRVTAIIAAYNEEDVVGQVVEDLVDQGISVYLIDDGSSDGTIAAVEAYRDRGVVGIERRQRGDGGSEGSFSLEAILSRKEAVAARIDSDWFINHDADEFRESPWGGVTLADGIRRVDALGYNAIDFEVLNFPPTHGHFRRGDDPRASFTHYEGGGLFDKLQVRCWKRTGANVDLVSSGGHEARFEGRRIFPLRFLLRHYPVRSQAHGERKVFLERRPRFAPVERERGWHVQYDAIQRGHVFLRDAATLVPYDPVDVRIQVALRHRGIEELESKVSNLERLAGQLRSDLESRAKEVEQLNLDLVLRGREKEQLDRDLVARGGEIEARTREKEQLDRDVTERGREIEALERDLETRTREKEQLDRDLETQTRTLGEARRDLAEQIARRERTEEDLLVAREEIRHVMERLHELESSLTWRLTAPLRSVADRLRGRR
jgi:hypothetical protein